MAKRGRPKSSSIQKGTVRWHVQQNPFISAAELSRLLKRPINGNNVSAVRSQLRNGHGEQIPKLIAGDKGGTHAAKHAVVRRALLMLQMPVPMIVAELARPPFNLIVSKKTVLTIRLQMKKEGVKFHTKFEFAGRNVRTGAPMDKRHKIIKLNLENPKMGHKKLAKLVGASTSTVANVRSAQTKKWGDLGLRVRSYRPKK